MCSVGQGGTTRSIYSASLLGGTYPEHLLNLSLFGLMKICKLFSKRGQPPLTLLYYYYYYCCCYYYYYYCYYYCYYYYYYSLENSHFPRIVISLLTPIWELLGKCLIGHFCSQFCSACAREVSRCAGEALMRAHPLKQVHSGITIIQY